MKTIISIIEEIEAGTPGNTMGMGNPMPPIGDIPGSEPILPLHRSSKKRKTKKKIKESIFNDVEDIVNDDTALFNDITKQLIDDGLFSDIRYSKCSPGFVNNITYDRKTNTLNVSDDIYIFIPKGKNLVDVFSKYTAIGIKIDKIYCKDTIRIVSNATSKSDLPVISGVFIKSNSFRSIGGVRVEDLEVDCSHMHFDENYDISNDAGNSIIIDGLKNATFSSFLNIYDQSASGKDIVLNNINGFGWLDITSSTITSKFVKKLQNCIDSKLSLYTKFSDALRSINASAGTALSNNLFSFDGAKLVKLLGLSKNGECLTTICITNNKKNRKYSQFVITAEIKGSMIKLTDIEVR